MGVTHTMWQRWWWKSYRHQWGFARGSIVEDRQNRDGSNATAT